MVPPPGNDGSKEKNVIAKKNHVGSVRKAAGPSKRRAGLGVLLAALFLAGCRTPTPPPLNVQHYYSTFDHEGVAPSERVLRHGPYHLDDVHATVANLDGRSMFFAPRRNDPDWRHGPRSVHEYRDILVEMAQLLAGTEQVDVADLLMATTLRVASFHAPFYALTPTSTNDTERYLSIAYQCRISGGVDSRNSYCHDFQKMRARAMLKHPELFPATGKGKRLKLWIVHAGITSARENPDMPFPYDVWGAYVGGGTNLPKRKISFMTFCGHPGGTMTDGEHARCPVDVDPQSGQATLNLPEGRVPLHGSPGVVSNGCLNRDAYRDLFGDRLAAMAIQLLNGMTDEELDALEDGEW